MCTVTTVTQKEILSKKFLTWNSDAKPKGNLTLSIQTANISMVRGHKLDLNEKIYSPAKKSKSKLKLPQPNQQNNVKQLGWCGIIIG